MARRMRTMIYMLCICTAIIFYSSLRAEGESQERVTAQQNSQGTQKKAPSISIMQPKIEVVPAIKIPEPRGTKGKEEGSVERHPQITIDSTLYDAGEVEEGEEIVHSFIVKNRGEAQLNIKSVAAG